MLAGFLLGFAHDRRLMREARFRKIFRRTVSACVDAGIAKGEVVHVDATLVRADAGWKSMVGRHAEAVASGNGDAAVEEGTADGESKTEVAADGERRKANVRPASKRKKVSRTDGDASLATSRKGQRPRHPSARTEPARGGAQADVAAKKRRLSGASPENRTAARRQ